MVQESRFYVLYYFFLPLWQLSPNQDITNLLCDLVRNGSAAIVYFSNSEEFGRSTAASQYFIKMAGFLGVPVIAWNADNVGLEKVGGWVGGSGWNLSASWWRDCSCSCSCFIFLYVR